MNIIEYENHHEDIQHGDFNFPYTTYICSIPLDFTNVPLHWHEEMEMIYIKKGEGLVTIDFTTYHVRANTILFIYPGQLHEIRQYKYERMEYENILYHPDFLTSIRSDDICNQFIQDCLKQIDLLPSVLYVDHPYYPQVSMILDQCDQLSDARPSGYPVMIKSLLLQLLALFLQIKSSASFSKPESEEDFTKLKLALKYMEMHYYEKITIADMAKVTEFSESHFMYYFKKNMGVSFIEYLKDYRLTMASRLLKSTDSTILAIAMEVGFDNLSYFNRSFKKKYGCTPGTFRK